MGPATTCWHHPYGLAAKSSFTYQPYTCIQRNAICTTILISSDFQVPFWKWAQLREKKCMWLKASTTNVADSQFYPTPTPSKSAEARPVSCKAFLATCTYSSTHTPDWDWIRPRWTYTLGRFVMVRIWLAQFFHFFFPCIFGNYFSSEIFSLWRDALLV